MKWSIKNYLMLFLFFPLLSAHSQERDSLLISMESALEIAGADNLTIQEYKFRQELAQASLTKAKEWWLPEVYAGVQTHYLNGTAMNADGRFFTDVHRENLWSGLGFNAAWDFGEGIYASRAERYKVEAMEFESQAERNQALLKVIDSYYDLLMTQLSSIAYRNMAEEADTIVQQLQVQVEIGRMYQSELLLAKSNLNLLKSKVLDAYKVYLSNTAELLNLLDLEPGTRLLSTDSILAPINLIPESEWNSSTEGILSKRPEYQQLSSGIQGLEIEKRTVTTGLLLPTLRIGTYYGVFGDVISPVYGTGEVNASLMWRIPLGDITTRGRLKEYDARLAIQQNRLRQFENQVNEEVLKAKSAMVTADEQLQLTSEAQELAEEAFEQTLQRQRLGTATALEVFKAQEFYLQARLEYLETVAEYNKAQYELYVEMGNNL